MIELSVLILVIGALVFAAHFFAWLFSFTAVPDGLLLMAAGFILGTWVTPDFFGSFGDVALTIALIVILFEAGTTLDISTLRGAFADTLRLSVTGFVVSMASVAVALRCAVAMPWPVALIIGAIVGGTTAEVVVSLLKRIVVQEQTRTVLILEAAFTDVLSIVATLALVTSYLSGTLSISHVATVVAMSFSVSAVLGVAAGFVWSVLLDQIRHIRHSIFVTPAFVFVLYGLVEVIGLSGLVAALFFGMVLGNIGLLKQWLGRHRLLQSVVHPDVLSRRERAFFGEAVFVLQTFFFVYVGLSLRATDLTVLLFTLGLAALLLAGRYVAVRTGVSHRTSSSDVVVLSAMIPRGLAAAVLATLVTREAVVGGEVIQEVVFGIILWTIVLTSVLVFLLERTALKHWWQRTFSGYGTEPLPGLDQKVL